MGAPPRSSSSRSASLRAIAVWLSLTSSPTLFRPVASFSLSTLGARLSSSTSTSVLLSNGDDGASSASRRLVWFTGREDLRWRDHGGLDAALEAVGGDASRVVPVFSRRDAATTSFPEREVRALRDALPSLVVLRRERDVAALATEVGATACHVVEDDVSYGDAATARRRRAAERALTDAGATVATWTNALRPGLWADHDDDHHAAYAAAADGVPATPPGPDHREAFAGTRPATPDDEGAFGADGDDDAWSSSSTAGPYADHAAANWRDPDGARAGLDEYLRDGRDVFADRHFAERDVGDDVGSDLAAAAAARLVRGNRPRDVLAPREAATRAFSAALSSGVLSAREIKEACLRNNDATNQRDLRPSVDPWWGRSTEGALSDVVEWREWYRTLARKYSSSSPPPREQRERNQGEGGDPRLPGTTAYWNFKGQHLVRYESWPAGTNWRGDAPALLLVHGFAASAEQWERFVHALTERHADDDDVPPVYALDLLGFGLSEKPGFSYTQYTWESQIVDFANEVVLVDDGGSGSSAVDGVVLVGNSIGGGVSAGAAATLGSKRCRGVVLCNTAGVLEDPDEHDAFRSRTAEALAGWPNDPPYAPVPLVGNRALDVFGRVVVGAIYPNIATRLRDVYDNNPANADERLTEAVRTAAAGPGAANVVGSGQKLAPQRPLNEVLADQSNVLVIVGEDDRVSSPAVAKKRADLFERSFDPSRVRVVRTTEAGHCPHDDRPDVVADAVRAWYAERFGDDADANETTTTTNTVR